MSNPTEADWINAARDIWNWDNESDVWIPEAHDEACGLFDKCDMEADVGAWVTGARVWISREQLDNYLAMQKGEKASLRFPSIDYPLAPAPAGE
jgi:hypothetical protein